MSLEAAEKYKFEGIGKASATATFLAMSLDPRFASLTQGFTGKVIFSLLTYFYSGLASIGLVVLNIGISRIQVISERKEFDGSFDDAFKIINEKGSRLTKEERDAIDMRVINAHNHFGSFGELFNN